MGLFWYTLILVVLLTMYYLAKSSTWRLIQLEKDNKLLCCLIEKDDEGLNTILHDCGVDKFGIKNIHSLSKKEGKQYLQEIEVLLEKIQSSFESECAKLLIAHRDDNVNYLLEVEQHCKSADCKTCKFSMLKKELIFKWALFPYLRVLSLWLLYTLYDFFDYSNYFALVILR